MIVVVCLIAGFTLNEQLTHTLNSFEPGFHLKPTTCMLQITENILRCDLSLSRPFATWNRREKYIKKNDKCCEW